MEFLLNRYRNLTVLLVVIVAQLILIAYQVKTSKDVPLIRVWAVTAVTPVEHVLEIVRRNTWGFVQDYFVLLHTRSENESLRWQIGQLKLHNQYLTTELSRADRARALSVFQAHSPSKTLAAQIIGNGTGANSKAVFIDRGSTDGVEAGMAVVTPDGIVAKVVAAYPTASLILLITDTNFAAGVVSQKNRVHGTLKGQGHDGTVLVDYVQNEENIDRGEWFFTSGEDRVFPKGFPVGQVTTVRNGRNSKEIYVTPSGFQNGIQEVLVVLNAAHREIPGIQMASPGYKLLQAPPEVPGPGAPGVPQQSTIATEADKLKEQYRQVGVAEKHVFGEGLPGSPPPDFTRMGLPRTAETAVNGASPLKPGTSAVPNREQADATRPAADPAKDLGGPPISVAKTAPAAAAAASAGTAPPAIAVRPAARPSGPLLVTDPTDADPSEPAPPSSILRPEKASRPPELNEFGEPKQSPRAAPKRAISVDKNTEILPPAPPPRSTARYLPETGSSTAPPAVGRSALVNSKPAVPKLVPPKQPSGTAVPHPPQ